MKSIKKVYFSEFISDDLFSKYEKNFVVIDLDLEFIKNATHKTDIFLNKEFLFNIINENNIIFFSIYNNMDIDFYSSIIRCFYKNNVFINLVLEDNKDNIKNDKIYDKIIIL